MRIVKIQSNKTKGALIYKSESFNINTTKFFSYQVPKKGMLICISWIYSPLIYGKFNFFIGFWRKWLCICMCSFILNGSWTNWKFFKKFSRNIILFNHVLYIPILHDSSMTIIWHTEIITQLGCKKYTYIRVCIINFVRWFTVRCNLENTSLCRKIFEVISLV